MMKKMRIFKKSKVLRAFTLIELLVVISIIGLLSTLAIVALNTAKAKARDAKRMNDLKTISQTLEVYYLDNGTYPISCSEAEVPNPCPPYQQCGSQGIVAYKNRICSGSALISGSGQIYLDPIPSTPTISKTDYFYYYMVSRKCSAPCIDILLEERAGKDYVLFWCQKGGCAKAQKVADTCPLCKI